jgi:hypothetical protein
MRNVETGSDGCAGCGAFAVLALCSIIAAITFVGWLLDWISRHPLG